MAARNSITGSILRLGVPILIGQLGTIVVGFADTTMVGHYSTAALASASFVNNLFNVAVFASLGFAYGLTPLVGALFGRGESERIGSLVRAATIANVAFALLLTAIMSFIYLNLEHLGQPEELLPVIRPYFLIVLAGMIPLTLFNLFSQWSYAINRTRMPMWIILGCNALNILGNYLLIYGHLGFPEMGLNGAGVSTLAARSLSALVIIAIFFGARRFRAYSRGFRRGRLSWRTLRQVTVTSLPVSLQMTFESGSFTVAAVMAGWIGAIELAAFQIIVIIGTLGFCVYYSIAAAVSVLVANAAGVADRRMMRRTAFAGYRIMLLLATAASLFFIFGGGEIMPLFTDDSLVMTTALAVIVPLVLYQFGDATQITFANALRGTANVMPMLWISFVSYVIVGIPVTYLLGFTARLGLYGIILSFSASLFLAAALFLYFFLRTTRKPAFPATFQTSNPSPQ